MPITLNGSTGIIDDSGNLRVGTSTNTNNSRIVSNGVVESTTGGFRFPDGTTQTTAAINLPAAYAVGSYVVAAKDNSGTVTTTAGETVAGSSLLTDGSASNNVTPIEAGASPTFNYGLSGTWRAMQAAGAGQFAFENISIRITTLWMRIS